MGCWFKWHLLWTKIFVNEFTSMSMTPSKVLELIKYIGCYPIISVAYWILLTTLVNVTLVGEAFQSLTIEKL